MDDAEMLNKSHYRRAFNYLKTTVQTNSYVNGRLGGTTKAIEDHDVAAVTQSSVNQLELVFFPSYARTFKDKSIKLDVRIHGWLYSPIAASNQSRRNRYTMLLARSIAGLPALPTTDTRPATTGSLESEDSSGQPFAQDPAIPASPTADLLDIPELYRTAEPVPDERTRQNSELSVASGTSASTGKSSRHFNENDIVRCHANLASRMAPFLAKPVLNKAVKVQIFAKDTLIMTENMYTGDNGHFRGTIEVEPSALVGVDIQALEARIAEGESVPSGCTDIRVLEEVGVSIISDMDDTVKHTDILGGMREAFRNAFVRDLSTLEVPGVYEWYNSMASLGCPIHYVSNAPYQLWPCLASFIHTARLPLGTIHLKQYSGMIQGLFEPAAEKKRANVTRILLDFPSRKFILIGDSGEQDLELYTELAQTSFASQILGIFIRDVSSGAVMANDSVGASGEAFFSPGAHDDMIDRIPSHASTMSSAVPEEQSQSDNTIQKAKTNPVIVPSVPLRTMTAPVREANPKGKSSEAAATVSEQATSRKPTGLRRLLTRLEDMELTKTSSTGSSSTAESLDDKALVSPTKRPGILRTMSANSASYVENRKLTSAEKMSRRVARARALLPTHIKMYIWKDGGDCQEYALSLIRNAMEEGGALVDER